LRVKPIKRGVDSLTCGEGGRFHSGIGGRSAEELALAARGKLSIIGGDSASGGLWRTLGGSVGAAGRGSRSSSLGMETLPVEILWTMKRVVAMMKGTKRRMRVRRSLPCGNMLLRPCIMMFFHHERSPEKGGCSDS